MGKLSRTGRIREGSVADLADQLRTLPLELEGVDRVAAAADAIGYALEQVAGQISKHARIARNIADIIAETDQEKDRSALFASAVWFFSTLWHFKIVWPPPMKMCPPWEKLLGRTSQACVILGAIFVHKIDYVPVFQLAADIIDILLGGLA